MAFAAHCVIICSCNEHTDKYMASNDHIPGDMGIVHYFGITSDSSVIIDAYIPADDTVAANDAFFPNRTIVSEQIVVTNFTPGI